MANRVPNLIGVGNSTNYCERSVRDIAMNAQFNPVKNAPECFGPNYPSQRTSRDQALQAQFGKGCEGFTQSQLQLLENPYNKASFLIKH